MHHWILLFLPDAAAAWIAAAVTLGIAAAAAVLSYAAPAAALAPKAPCSWQ